MKNALLVAGYLALTAFFLGCSGGSPIIPVNNPPVWSGTAGILSLDPADQSITVRFGTATDPDSANPVTYNLYYYMNSDNPDGNPFVSPNTVIENVTSPFQLTGILNGTKYTFGVRAVDSEGNEDSNTVIKSSRPCLGGNLMWAKNAGGTQKASAVLSDDSVVVTGVFGTQFVTETFGEGELNETMLESVDYTSGLSLPRFNQMPPGPDPDVHGDIFIARYESDGSLVWAKSAGAANTDYQSDSGSGITYLSDDSIVVTGRFEGEATFGAGEANETVLKSDDSDIEITWSPTYYNDIFIARYNTDGTLAWAKRAGGPGDDIGGNIKALPDNSLIATGYFSDTATFAPGEVNETMLTAADGWDYFFAKYNPDGTLAWVKSIECSISDLAALSDNSYVLTGRLEYTVTLGTGEANETTLTPMGWVDMFVARFNPDGSLMWAKNAGGASSDTTDPYITRLSDNSVVVTGIFENTSTFGAGEANESYVNCKGWRDIFIAKYNPDGTLAWAKSAGGSGWDSSWSITALSDDSIVICGMNYEGITFGTGELNETFLYESQYFLARFYPDGTLKWAKSTGGAGYGMVTLSDDTPFLSGAFYNNRLFGLGELNETVMTGGGDFMARFEN